MPSVLTTMIIHRRDTQRTRSTSLWVQYNVAPLQTIHPPNHSPSNELLRQYHNQQNQNHVTNLSNPLSPHTTESVEIDCLPTFYQYPSSAASLVAALQTVRVSSLSLSTVAPLNGRFPHLAVTSHIPYPIQHLEVESPQWSEILGRLSVNQWPFYHPDHFLGSTLSLIVFEFSVSSFQSLLSTHTLLLLYRYSQSSFVYSVARISGQRSDTSIHTY